MSLPQISARSRCLCLW